MTKSQVLDQVWADAAWRRPESLIIDRPDWFQVITPTSKMTQLNGIYRSKITTEVDKKILETIASYSKHQASFRWLVTADASPNNLSDYLIQLNFKHSHTAFGVCGDANTLTHMTNQDIRVEKLTEKELDEWVRVSIAGWTNYPLSADELKSDVLRIITDPKTPFIYYSAFYKNQMVGTATLRMGDSAHLFGGAVVPEFRGKGVYRAMISERAKLALSKNISLVTTHAMSNTSAPILLNLGFEKINEVSQYNFSF